MLAWASLRQCCFRCLLHLEQGLRWWRKSPRLISFDVFDTLVRRRCHPDAIKLLTARQLWLQQPQLTMRPLELVQLRRSVERRLGDVAKAEGFDDEYRAVEVLAECLRRLKVEEPESRAECLLRFEMEMERERLFLDPKIGRLLRAWPGIPKRFVTDFYVGAEQVVQLLRTAGVPEELTRGYASCDQRVNKRSGRLLAFVREQEGVSPEEHIHVGDSYLADIRPQRAAGGRAYWFLGGIRERRERRALARSWAGLARGDAGRLLRDHAEEWRTSPPGQTSGEAADLFAIGQELALLVVPLVLYILEEAVREQADTVWYFTREGELLRRVHEALAAERPLVCPLPRACLLEVSRQATFAASLHACGFEGLRRFWCQYSRHSLRTLLLSLGLQTERFAGVQSFRAVDLDTPIDRPWEDAAFLSLMRDESFREAFAAAIMDKHALLRAYLRGQGVPLDRGRCFVVDIGWRGSIQDNLALAFPQARFSGRYLGLKTWLSPQPPHTFKASFGPNANELGREAGVFENVSPLEMVFNSPRGSVSGYRWQADGVEVLRTSDPAEEAVYEQSTRFLQEGLLAATPGIARLIRRHGVCSDALRPLAMEVLARLVHRPPGAVARAYFALRHNELFGLGVFVDKNRAFPYADLAWSLFSARSRERVNESLRLSGWPEGFLVARGLGWLLPLYRLRRRQTGGSE